MQKQQCYQQQSKYVYRLTVIVLSITFICLIHHYWKSQIYPNIYEGVHPLPSQKYPLHYYEAEKDIYLPLGLRIWDLDQIPRLYYHRTQVCKEKLFENNPDAQPSSESPIPPPQLLDAFTMRGHGNLVLTDDLQITDQLPNEDTLELAILNHVQVGKIFISGELHPEMIARMKEKPENTITVLQKEGLSNTFEGVTYSNYTQIKKSLPKDMGEYDFAIVSSHVEFLGIGRTYDSIDPNADMHHIANVRCLLRNDGLLLLSVPVGADCVIWKNRRVYGRIRLALLFAGFDMSHFYLNGLSEPQVLFPSETFTDFHCQPSLRPVFVLKKL